LRAEQEWSALRRTLDVRWLTAVEPDVAHPDEDPPGWRACNCLDLGQRNRRRVEAEFHREPQDTECEAGNRLLELGEQAPGDGRQEFAWEGLDRHDPARIVTLPPMIAKLKAVRRLLLNGSPLVRIPAEIGEMTSLEEFDPYTSYRLHWFPYEITRCKNLRKSRVSTRALYGNFKTRLPFPRLSPRNIVPSHTHPHGSPPLNSYSH